MFLFSTAIAQTESGIDIIHKKKKYYLTKICYDIINWEEIALKKKDVQHKINSAIRKAVQSYKEDSSLLCDGELDYSAARTFKVVYANHGLISYYLESDIYHKGILHDFHYFNTLNFDTKTGEQVTFDKLIDHQQLSGLYALVLAKISRERALHGLDPFDPKAELEHQNFLITNNGIKILYLFQGYPMDITISFKELEPYMKKNGLLKRFYGNIKHSR